MRIAVDAREAQNPRPTGKGVFAREVLRELQRRGIPLTPFGGPPSTLWHWRTARRLRRYPPDVYLSPTSYIVPYLLRGKVPCVPVVHDLIAFDPSASLGAGSHDRKAKLIERFTLPRVLRTAAHLIAVSEATKRELLERFPSVPESRVTVVYEGPTIRTCHDPRSSNEKRGTSNGSTNQYILSIGTLCPRKNQLRLIQAYEALPERLRQRYKLLLVGGRGWDDDAIVQRATSTPGVEWRGYLSQEEVHHLLSHATVFAYPSLKEGFGLPVLDALTLGIPTLTSNRSSLAEVAGDAAFLVDPEDAGALREGLERILTDQILQQRLRAAGPERASRYSWGSTVDLLLQACGKI